MKFGSITDQLLRRIILAFNASLLQLLIFTGGVSFGYAEDSFLLLKNVPFVDGNGIAVELDGSGRLLKWEAEQAACLLWIDKNLPLENGRNVISEIKVGFDRSAFGQIVLGKLIHAPSGDISYAPVIAHCIAVLRNDRNPFDLGFRGRLVFENNEAQVQLSRALLNSIDISDYGVEWPGVSENDLREIRRLIDVRIGLSGDLHEKNILRETLYFLTKVDAMKVYQASSETETKNGVSVAELSDSGALIATNTKFSGTNLSPLITVNFTGKSGDST